VSHVFDSVVNSVIFVVQVNIWHESLAQIFHGEKSAANHLETVYLLGPHDHEPSCDYFLGLATTAAMADYSQEPNTLWRNHPKLLGPGALIFVAKQL